MPKTLDVEVVFVSRHAGIGKESQKPYDILAISNGIRTGSISFDPTIGTELLKEGDKCIATMQVTMNFKNEWGVYLTKLVKAK